MPKGPNGQKRPADAIGRAIMVAKIATGEVVEGVQDGGAPSRGSKGGHGRAAALTATERAAIATRAAKSRWQKGRPAPGKKEQA